MLLPKRQVDMYYQEDKVLASQCHQPDKISHTRGVLSRYAQEPIVPKQSPNCGRRSYAQNTAGPEHPKNQSGTANFSSVDHHHGLGNVGGGDGVKEVVSFTSHNLNSGLNSENDVHAHAFVSSEPLILRSDSPSEKSRSIFGRKLEFSKGHESENINKITNIRNSPHFTLASPDSPVFHTIDVKQPLKSFGTFRNIQHPNIDENLIQGIDDIIKLNSFKGEQYVPVSDQAECFMNYDMQNLSEYSPYSAQSDFHSSYEEPNIWSSDNSSLELNSFDEQLITPSASMFYVDDFLMSVNKNHDFNPYMQDITEAVFDTLEDSSRLCPSNFLKIHGEDLLLSRSEFSNDSRIYNVETEYHHDTPSQSDSHLSYKLEQWSPKLEECKSSSPKGAVKNLNDKISQSTASDIYTHRTPSTRDLSRISATKVSLNEMESTEESQLQPMRRKRHLLPSELDIYWKGPDDDKNYVCIYENCGKKFTRKYNVRTHIQTHLGDRPFVCKICRKGFVRRHDFNRHTRLHTASQKKKAFGNSTCGIYDQCNEWSKYEVIFNSRSP